MFPASPAATVTVRLIGGADGFPPRTIPILGSRFLIGRDPSCQLRPRNQLVSRRHAEIRIMDGEVTIVDLDSRNGTAINGEPVSLPTPLEDGDMVQVGPIEFRISIDVAEVEAEEPSKVPSDHELAQWLLGDKDEQSPDVTREPRG